MKSGNPTQETPEQRAERAYHARLKGLSWSAVAQECGFANGAGARLAALRHDALLHPITQEERERERARMLTQISELYPVSYRHAQAPGGNPLAEANCRRLEQLRLRLLGVDPWSAEAETLCEGWRLLVDLTTTPPLPPDDAATRDDPLPPAEALSSAVTSSSSSSSSTKPPQQQKG